MSSAKYSFFRMRSGARVFHGGVLPHSSPKIDRSEPTASPRFAPVCSSKRAAKRNIPPCGSKKSQQMKGKEGNVSLHYAFASVRSALSGRFLRAFSLHACMTSATAIDVYKRQAVPPPDWHSTAGRCWIRPVFCYDSGDKTCSALLDLQAIPL